MEQEVYNQKVKELDDEFKTRKFALQKEYALANNPYKQGDTVSDHKCTILIDKISIYCNSYPYFPCCIYEGVILNKDGSVNKKTKRDFVYQSNINKPKC